MCLQCHNYLSEEDILESLKEDIKNPQFDQWNTTSINHIVISALGNENLECRKIAIELLEKFIRYRRSKQFKDFYRKMLGKYTDDGFVLSVKELKLILKKVKDYPAETLDSTTIHNAIYKEGLIHNIYGVPYNPNDVDWNETT